MPSAPNLYPEEAPTVERPRDTWRDADAEAFAAASVRCVELGGKVEANVRGSTFLWLPADGVPALRLVGTRDGETGVLRLLDREELR